MPGLVLVAANLAGCSRASLGGHWSNLKYFDDLMIGFIPHAHDAC
jgi:hypothetical protein